MKNPPKDIKNILKKTQLFHIIEKANSLNELNYKIQSRLPQAYKGLYRVANLKEGVLIIDVQNGAVKSGLQLQQSELLALIKIDFSNVTGLSFRVNPNLK